MLLDAALAAVEVLRRTWVEEEDPDEGLAVAAEEELRTAELRVAAVPEAVDAEELRVALPVVAELEELRVALPVVVELEELRVALEELPEAEPVVVPLRTCPDWVGAAVALLRVAEVAEELRVAEAEPMVPAERFTCVALERCWVEEDRTALEEALLRVALDEALLRTAEEVLPDEELPEVVVLRVAEDELPLRRV